MVQKGSKTGKNKICCKFFEKRKNKKKEITQKEHNSLWRTNKQETVSFEKKRDSTKRTI